MNIEVILHLSFVQDKARDQVNTTALTPEQSKLVASHVNFARWYAREYGGTASERQEAVAVCMLALTQAAKSYDPTRMIEFSTYSGRLMRNALVAAWRNRRRCAAVLLEDASLIVDDSGQTSLGFANERALNWLRTKGMKIAAASEIELDILKGLFDYAHLHSVARKYGYSVHFIRDRRDELFARLREHAKLDGLI